MTGYIPTPDFYNDYIAHHGIKGQKWGVRNGPPYPLNSGSKSGSKKSSGSAKSEGKSPKKSQPVYGSSVKAAKSKKNRLDEVANDNQDMFNDILYRAEHDSDEEADKESRKLLRQIAKENGVNYKQLGEKIYSNYQSREKEIATKDVQRQHINQRLQNAKTRDQWDLNFLEATQNAPWTEAHTLGEMSDSTYKNKMLQEYRKYLENPEEYWKNRY